jgi:hypothetical protein
MSVGARPPSASSATAGASADPARAQALAQERLRWYTSQARKARLGYQSLELVQLLAGALVPLAVALGWGKATTAALGAVVVLAGGMRTLFQWHDNWLGFVGAQLRIERELALYEVGARPYDDGRRGQTLMVEVEAVVMEETRSWTTRRKQDDQPAASDG